MISLCLSIHSYIYVVQCLLLLLLLIFFFDLNFLYGYYISSCLNFAGIFIRGSLISRFFHNREKNAKFKTREITNKVLHVKAL